MAGFVPHYGVIEGEAEVFELVSTEEGGEEAFEFEIPPDTEMLLVVTEGEGRAYLNVNGVDVGPIPAEDTRLAVVSRDRVEVYLDTRPRPGTGRLTLWHEAGENFVGRIVRFTRMPGNWIQRQIQNGGRCWTCKKIVRSILEAVGGVFGIPAIPFLDDVIGEGGEALDALIGEPNTLPLPLRELLERFFGDDWLRILREILSTIGQGPFGLIANEICRRLGYCPA
jgi:hypothetical protein